MVTEAGTLSTEMETGRSSIPGNVTSECLFPGSKLSLFFLSEWRTVNVFDKLRTVVF